MAGYSDTRKMCGSASGVSRDRFEDCSGWSARTPTAPMCSRRSQPPPKLCSLLLSSFWEEHLSHGVQDAIQAGGPEADSKRMRFPTRT
jgi:hypothetical protein